MKYRKKPVIIEATQWFKNGDHPLDHESIGIETPTAMDRTKYGEYLETEGSVVRYFRHPEVSGETACKHCSKTMHDHGWVDTLEGGHIVCPGDWIITGVEGEHYPCKPNIFEQTYEPAEHQPAPDESALAKALEAALDSFDDWCEGQDPSDIADAMNTFPWVVQARAALAAHRKGE